MLDSELNCDSESNFGRTDISNRDGCQHSSWRDLGDHLSPSASNILTNLNADTAANVNGSPTSPEVVATASWVTRRPNRQIQKLHSTDSTQNTKPSSRYAGKGSQLSKKDHTSTKLGKNEALKTQNMQQIEECRRIKLRLRFLREILEDISRCKNSPLESMLPLRAALCSKRRDSYRKRRS
jgi:hypothetical protein